MIDATPLLRAFAARRRAVLAGMDPLRAQRATLARLLRRAAGTRFGRDHDFAEIRTVADYQARVKLRRYEAFWREYWQPAFPVLRDVTWPGLIPCFAQSSGTTGGPTKHIPVSAAMMRSNTGAAFDCMAFHLAARPGSRVFGGRNFLLGGSVALERLAPGVRAGDLSGIAADRMPGWARARAFPPRELALIGDWEAKVAALAPGSLAQDIRSISGTPSWMLLFFEQLAALRPGRPRRLVEYWPDLELLVHGGVAFTPYRDAMAAWLEGSHAETREVYPASEGFIAVADRGPGEGLRLMTDRGLFFEFVRPDALDRPDPDRRWLGTAEPGVEYALVLTTNAGLWSYVLGDTVVLTDRDPPRLLVTGRTAFTLSAFGEHLIAQELDAAVTEAARAFAAGVADYAAGPLFPTAGQPRGGHLFVVELASLVPDDAVPFARVLDAALARLNADYADHRRGDFGMLPPQVRLVPPGTFAAWMRRRGRLGGQNKVPRVINDPALLADLRGFIGER
ncbi:GH3 auxin-responsive promoter family protein [Rhodovastum atsumiense]|uniref:GH3 auxin-responsive promoter family protein n=1 Tax=Rhodovastum atsumiense TaxID=504468 RepID=A0A5M6J227_9PROT|nr:GH3 auxin-responsive promoter family protein [Rhodovastum atsumiense]KAA5614650.1 GH3 auxin-responsive promoter family protein [Rhodovastum atsumiense]CAH2599832.1 GH3 auxin-responsive promoter family protein [Rhodovastum atsumiense]